MLMVPQVAQPGVLGFGVAKHSTWTMVLMAVFTFF